MQFMHILLENVGDVVVSGLYSSSTRLANQGHAAKVVRRVHLVTGSYATRRARSQIALKVAPREIVRVLAEEHPVLAMWTNVDVQQLSGPRVPTASANQRRRTDRSKTCIHGCRV